MNFKIIWLIEFIYQVDALNNSSRYCQITYTKTLPYLFQEIRPIEAQTFCNIINDCYSY